MKSLHAILKDLENKTPTKEDYLNIYNRIKYSIENAYPIEKRDYSPAKSSPKTDQLTEAERHSISSAGKRDNLSRGSASRASTEESSRTRDYSSTSFKPLGTPYVYSFGWGRTSYDYKLLTKTAWIYREIMKVIEYGKSRI